MKQWLTKRDGQLFSLLSLEAPSNSAMTCQGCAQQPANWRCLECFGRRILCHGCCQKSHMYLPFHRVESWTGTHFAPAWLWQNGIVIHTGHNGEACPAEAGPWEQADDTNSEISTDDSDLMSEADPDLAWETDSEGDDNPEPDEERADARAEALQKSRRRPPIATTGPLPADPRKAGLGLPILTIVDVTGVHELPVRYCTCSPIPRSNDSQLFECELFPASYKRVSTVFTFRVLNDFRSDNLESHTTAYSYYNKLRSLTDPQAPHSVKVRYNDMFPFQMVPLK